MRQYVALIHKDADSDYGVSFPDLPGVISAGSDLDEARAMARLHTWIGSYYGNPDLADRWCIVGTASVIAEKLAELVGAGATHLMLNPVFDEMEHLEIVAKEIAPLI